MPNYKQPVATLLHASPLVSGEVAGRICYDSFGMSENPVVQNFREDPTTLMGNDIDSSSLLDTLINVYFHESVAEHINLTFHIKDISREVVLEMNRHRIGIATSQKSSRYTIESLVNTWIIYNNSLLESDWLNFYNVVAANIVHTKPSRVETTAIYINEMLKDYNSEESLKPNLSGGAKKKQNDRVKRCLPESWMLEGVWTFNLRSLKHFLELRDSGAAYYGIREVATTLKAQLPHKYRALIDKKYRKEIND